MPPGTRVFGDSLGSVGAPSSITAAAGAAVTDQRLLKGARTRRIVLRAAVDVASLDGLDGVTFGRLATATGLSKAGIQTLFRTKEALQLATCDHARSMFADTVTGPAESMPRGIARLGALIGRWVDYARDPLFQGGCFWAATLSEYDSRPGPVRDRLFQHQAEWLALLAREIRYAVEVDELEELDPDLTAIQLDAVLCSTNIALRRGDGGAVGRAHRIVESVLARRR